MTKSFTTSALGFELNGYFIFIEVDPAYPEEVPGLFEGDIDLQPGDNPLVSILKPSSNWSLSKLIISDQTLLKLK